MLYRATSDPNLNMRKDGTMTSEMGDNAQQYLSKVMVPSFLIFRLGSEYEEGWYHDL